MFKRVENKVITIPQITVSEISFTLIGMSPLIIHAWSAKARKAMLDKQTGAPINKKEHKDPFQDFVDCLYWITKRPAKVTPEIIKKATFGLPARMIKQALVNACRFVENFPMTKAKGCLYVQGELLPIKGSVPISREDMVRLDNGSMDIRFRPEFYPWEVNCTVTAPTNVVTAESVINLMSVAGQYSGLGEWRPERGGSYGRFKVKHR